MTGVYRIGMKILPYICVGSITLFMLFEFTDVEFMIKTFKQNYDVPNDNNTKDIPFAKYRNVIHGVKKESRRFGEYSKEEFLKDHVPNTTDGFDFNDTIHICITIGGADAAKESRFLLRSLYIHARRMRLYFHFIVTADAKRILQAYMSEMKIPAVDSLYEFVEFNPEFVKRRAESVRVRITHHSGVFGMSKSFMYDMLSHVEKCLILDTDLIFGTDPAFLWSRFNDLEPSYFGRLKLGKNQNDMCSGVMLQRFSKMRKAKFDSFYKKGVPKFCKPEKGSTKGEKRFICRFGDQSMIYAAQLQTPLFKDLENSWTLELCREFRNHSLWSWRENDHLFFGIVHFNCLQVRRELESIDDYMGKYRETPLGHYLSILDDLSDISTKID